MIQLKSHPLAELLPMMSDAEFQALKADIAHNKGLTDAVVLYQGKILDGRNRYRACVELGIEAKTENFDPAWGDPLDFVYSRAIHRNLSTDQRACVALNFLDQYERNPTGRSAKRAGDLMGVNYNYVLDAKMLREKAPDLYAACFEGREQLYKAARKVKREEKTKAHETKAQAAAVAITQSDAFDLIVGDSVDVLPKLTIRPRLIFADPPYNIGIDYGDGVKADKLSDADYADWCMEWFEACESMLADDGSLFVMIDPAHLGEFQVMLAGVGCDLHYRSTIAWVETFGNYTDTNFSPCWRPILYFTKHKSRFVFNSHDPKVRIESDRQKQGDPRADPAGKVPSNVWTEFPRIVDNAAERMPGFPTQLPVALVERIVLACSEPGDLVLDPFNGSGTTGAAALRHGRRYVGIDKQPANIAFTRQRLTLIQHELQEGK